MSRITLIGVLALVIFLVAAGVVMAQGAGNVVGTRMMSSITTPVQADPSQPAPGPGNGWVCPIYGQPGSTPPSGVDQQTWDQMRQAMQSGDWQAMRDAMNNIQPNSDGTYGPGHLSKDTWDQMLQAMQSGDWQAMRNLMNGIDRSQMPCFGGGYGGSSQNSGTGSGGANPPASSRGRGMMGGGYGGGYGMMGSRA